MNKQDEREEQALTGDARIACAIRHALVPHVADHIPWHKAPRDSRDSYLAAAVAARQLIEQEHQQ
jgi:hypothetical protein